MVVRKLSRRDEVTKGAEKRNGQQREAARRETERPQAHLRHGEDRDLWEKAVGGAELRGTGSERNEENRGKAVVRDGMGEERKKGA